MPFYRWVERRYLQSVDGMVYNSKTTHNGDAVNRPRQTGVGCLSPADHRAPPPMAKIVQHIDERVAAGRPLQILFVGNVIARKGA
ncbi:MAG: hypothetical protein R2867_08440 [Caldilineaceae bacterium]